MSPKTSLMMVVMSWLGFFKYQANKGILHHKRKGPMQRNVIEPIEPVLSTFGIGRPFIIFSYPGKAQPFTAAPEAV